MKKNIIVIAMATIFIAISGCSLDTNVNPVNNPQDSTINETSSETTISTAATDSATPSPAIIMPQDMTPEQVIEAHYRNLYEGNFDEAISFIDEYSLECRDIVWGETVDEWRNRVYELLFTNDVTYLDILVQSIGSVGEYEGFSVNTKILVNGDEFTSDEGIMYLKKHDNTYKIVINDIIGLETLQTPNISNNELNIYVSHIVTLVNSYVVIIDYVNNSSKDYQFGWVNPGSVVLETDVNSYHVNYSIGSKVQGGRTYTDTFQFDNATGAIKSVSITNVVELNSSGLPVNTRDPSGVTITILSR